jgi:hypothetical protein
VPGAAEELERREQLVQITSVFDTTDVAMCGQWGNHSEQTKGNMRDKRP